MRLGLLSSVIHYMQFANARMTHSQVVRYGLHIADDKNKESKDREDKKPGQSPQCVLCVSKTALRTCVDDLEDDR